MAAAVAEEGVVEDLARGFFDRFGEIFYFIVGEFELLFLIFATWVGLDEIKFPGHHFVFSSIKIFQQNFIKHELTKIVARTSFSLAHNFIPAFRLTCFVINHFYFIRFSQHFNFINLHAQANCRISE